MAAKETRGSDTSTTPTYPELEIQKLHALPSEQQHLYLLTFTSELARHVSGLDSEGASANQFYVKKELFKVIELTSPAPTRIIRRNIGSCFAGIFGKGDRKLLFESVDKLLSILNSSKGAKDSISKHVAVYCLGCVLEAAGDSVINLCHTASSILLRLVKPSQNNTGFRAGIYLALGKIVRGVGRPLEEIVARDILKQARSAATSDRSLLVQRDACLCLEQLFTQTTHFDNSNDFDKLQSLIWRIIESPSPAVRRAAACCLSAIYVKNFSKTPNTLQRLRKQKKAKQQHVNGENEDQEVERSSSPAPPPQVTNLSFGLIDILRVLGTQYCRPGTNDPARAGITLLCIKVLRSLGDAIVEEEYNKIALFLFNELLSSPSVTNNRYRLLVTRKFVRLILGGIISCRMLGETAELNAIKFLSNNILKDYPQPDVKERPEPTKETLVAALDILIVLIDSLGSATNSVAEICRSVILQVIEHPSYTVQIHASACLKSFVLACPQQLLPVVTICMNSVNREIRQLQGPRRSPRRCRGHAYGLAAAISTSSQQPLYGSVDIYSRVLNQATAILKSSSGSDLRISSTQVQVAWILIGGLMSLGPNFAKIHLSQLLMLWRNALPKPLSKDNIGQRGLLELSFLAHVRECALGSIRSFLSFNGRLLTVDVSNRLATMLQNTTEFLGSLPIRKLTDDVDKKLSPSFQLQDYDLLVRRRVFDCYTQLLKLSSSESHDTLVQSNVLTLAVSSFADPDYISEDSLSTSIASSSGHFESIWDIGDNAGFGITSLVNGFNVVDLSSSGILTKDHWTSNQDSDSMVNQIVHTPVCTALEHDSSHLYIANSLESAPLGTSVVDAAIQFFSAAFPLQSLRVQEGVLEQITSTLSSTAPNSNPARESAMTANVSAALLLALQVASRDPSPATNMKAVEVERGTEELLHSFLNHSDQALRHIAAQCLGRLCKVAGIDFTSREVNYLITQVVEVRDPNMRSGCAMAFGCINSELGGMAAGFHLKNIHGILTSLASDPHPTVHYWALDGLSKIADSAGLAFSGYVSGTLGMLAQLYVAESHGEDSPSLATSNTEIDLPSVTAIARCLDSVINVLGPDLQDMTKARNMILTLTYQFQIETSQHIACESLKCLENLSMYAPGHISFGPYVRQLQDKLGSDDPDLQQTALTGLYNSMRRGAEEVLSVAGPSLEEQMWFLLHDMHGQGILRNIIKDWVEQSGVQLLDRWVPRVQAVLSKVRFQKMRVPTRTATKKSLEAELQDEEVAGFAAAASETAKDDPSVLPEASQELLRWQVRYTAMESLNEILSTVAREVSNYGESPHSSSLQSRIAEIVRIAFSASTASVVELRIQGIQIIGKVLQIFGRVPDPDFPEATLLEQYQAQISSALTPAFAADSSPMLAAEAVSVCAAFISTGIVKNAERMGRILRLLVSALEDFSKESDSASIGDLKGLSSNALIMVRLSVYSAWAELQIASHDQGYLKDVIKPHLARLTPLWLASLREYARLKFEPDISTAAASGVLNSSLDTIYASLYRDTLLKFYQASWLNFVNAIASLIEEDSELVFNALDDKPDAGEKDGGSKLGLGINYRDEPVAFFFVLFGISFEALVGRGNDSAITSARTLEIVEALHKILRPSVAGLAIYQEAIFSETMDLLDRLVLMEGLEVQTVIVQIACNLCLAHPSARKSSKIDKENDNNESLSDDIEQLFELTRIMVLVIAHHIPNLSEPTTAAPTAFSKESVPLVILSLTALASASEVFPSIIKADLHACILHVFTTILSTPACQDDLVPRALPIFRRFATTLSRNPQPESPAQLRNALALFLATLRIAQRRETSAAIPTEKNTLLAGTLLLSSASNLFPAGDPLITRFVDELTEALANRLTTSVAAGLCRSLLLTCTTSTAAATEAHMAARLLPRLLAFLVTPSDIEGTDEARASVAHSLTAFVAALKEAQKLSAMTVVVPGLLERASREGERTWRDTSVSLVEMATDMPLEFKALVKGMEPGRKAFMQEIIRRNEEEDGEGGEEGMGEGEDRVEPSIALKMDF